MARIALNAPDNKNRPLNTGDGTEFGDNPKTIIDNLNTMLTELYGGTGQTSLTVSTLTVVNTALIGSTSVAKVGFFGTTPASKPAATNQALASTATITPVATTLATSTTPFGFTTTAQANALFAAINSLITQVAALTTLGNQIETDLISLGLSKGTA